MSLEHRLPLVPAPSPGAVTVFTTIWCGYCRVLKSQLDREGVTYAEVDIATVPGAADYVMTVNGGNQTVPTVLFSDGSSATNPSIREVVRRTGQPATDPG